MDVDALGRQWESVFDDVRQAARDLQRGSKDYWSSTLGFLHAVDWSEPWLQGLIGCEVGLLLAALIWRRTPHVQLAILVACGAIIWLAEPINRLCAEYWEAFATQPYFDKRGSFVAGVVLVPLLFVMLVCLCNFLTQVIGEMIALKRRQLLASRKRDAARAKKAA